MKKYFTLLALWLLTLCLAPSVRAQTGASATANIDITLRYEKDGSMRLSCAAGCEWEALTFFNNRGYLALVDETGVSLEKGNEDLSTSASDFAFIIERRRDNLSLRSLNGGTAWEELSFSARPDETVRISQLGMTD